MVYKIVKSDELYHFGVKGMKWGVRKEEKRQAREHKKQAKADYKEIEKNVISKQENKLQDAYKKHQDAIYDLESAVRKGNKEAYRNGKISKEQYKENKRNALENRNRELDRAESKMAVGMYEVQRMRRANHLIYIADIKGKDSKAYKKGVEAWNQQTESYATGNRIYTIQKKKDGTYDISRTDYYY